MRITARLLLLSLLFSLSISFQAQGQTFAVLPDFTEHSEGGALTISRQSAGNKPFSVVGPRGALLGQQNGTCETWIFPWKIFSGLRITAILEDSPVSIDVNQQSAWIDVTPAHTTITYSHSDFTVKQIMMAPKQVPDGAGVLIFYKIEAVRPMTFTFSVDPVMQPMWPATSSGHVSAEWVTADRESGFYLLRDVSNDRYAAIAMPGAEPGIPPLNSGSTTRPLQFVLHFDPRKDGGTLFPLLTSFGEDSKEITTPSQEATKKTMADHLIALDDAAESIYEANENYYRNFLSQHTSIETPDKQLNAAFSWAEAAIDQLHVQTIPDRTLSALTAGFAASDDGTRPGFGWFFGRDALWSLYAVNSYGDFETTREEIQFLLHHQREDGKIMHEWPQTSAMVDWKSFPYEYASADSTPLLQMAADDYLKVSGDSAFVRSHWDALARAWQFETSHVSHDGTNNDGIYNNEQGTGWVESWVPAMPHQEIYLAALDEQASLAFADLAQITGHDELAQLAKKRARRIATKIENEYYSPAIDFYAFSHNANGSSDSTPTIFPSVAWWDGTFSLHRPQNMLSRWAAAEFSTDWGTRILSDSVSFYDPVSYHQGSVWPLFTGWVSLAEYRTGHTLSGYSHLMQNAELTWSQDLGSVTELLSGKFYQAAAGSTGHQLWSSAMVITPILRGMFGLDWNAADHTLSVTPHLPADWSAATLRQVPLGDRKVDLSFTRSGQELIVSQSIVHQSIVRDSGVRESSGGDLSAPGSIAHAGETTGGIHLQSLAAGAKVEGDTPRVPLPAVEITVKEELPTFGDETRQMKVLDQQSTAHEIKLTLAAPASSRQVLLVRENAPDLKIQTHDAEIGSIKDGLRTVVVLFPSGEGYVTKTVTLSW